MVTFEWWSRCSCPSVLQSHAPHSPDPGPCRPSVDRIFAPGPVVCAGRLRGQRPERFGQCDREHAEPAVHQFPLPGHAALGYGSWGKSYGHRRLGQSQRLAAVQLPFGGRQLHHGDERRAGLPERTARLARRDRPGHCAHPIVPADRTGAHRGTHREAHHRADDRCGLLPSSCRPQHLGHPDQERRCHHRGGRHRGRFLLHGAHGRAGRESWRLLQRTYLCSIGAGQRAARTSHDQRGMQRGGGSELRPQHRIRQLHRIGLHLGHALVPSGLHRDQQCRHGLQWSLVDLLLQWRPRVEFERLSHHPEPRYGSAACGCHLQWKPIRCIARFHHNTVCHRELQRSGSGPRAAHWLHPTQRDLRPGRMGHLQQREPPHGPRERPGDLPAASAPNHHHRQPRCGLR